MGKILFGILGIGKAIVLWVVGLIKAIFDFCAKHPLIAAAIFIDILLIAGCYWGYTRHRDALDKDVTITQLESDIEEKDTLIDQLYERLEQYVVALRESREDHVATIRENNQAVRRLKDSADGQLARAREEAERSKEQRDRYFKLSERYREALVEGGTPEERIEREEQINREFIRDFKEVGR